MSLTFTAQYLPLISEPDPWKIGKRVWEIGWGEIVPRGIYGICNY